MTFFQTFSAILALSALFAFINERYIKLPSAIALLLMGLAFSLAIQGVGYLFPALSQEAALILEHFDFSDFVLDFMLSFLLFAGALHTDWARLKEARGPVLTFATLGVALSTIIIGVTLYSVVFLFDLNLPFIYCLLFGALISPTDPIAVLGILRKANVPETTEIKIVGESLLNDGIGVVFFIVIANIAATGGEDIGAPDIALLFAVEVVGGIALGLISGWIVYYMLHKIDHYQTEVLLTLSLVMGCYALALALHVSGPLAMVASGLIIGNKGRAHAMSEMTMDYTFKFWEIMDEIMNAALFVLIGLELLVIPFSWTYTTVGFASVLIALGARYIALAGPSYLFRFTNQFKPHTIAIMTWGGLRGGISIALVLSIPPSPMRDMLLAMTYVVVLFSIAVQGLTIGRLVKRLE